MHMVTRLRRILAMMTVLLGLLAGLGIASAQADAPMLTGGGGRQTPRVAEQTPGILPSSATDTPLPSPSPIQATTPLSPTASPGTPSSTTGTPGSTDPAPTKSAEKPDEQTSHVVRFDPADGGKPTQSTVKTGTLAAPPQENPQRPGFRFDGWMLDGRPYDFRTPVLKEITLKAQWSKTTDWTLSPEHGPATGTRLTISPPKNQEPQFVSLQAAGQHIVGLTGDGRIHTWTREGAPKQVPAPAQAADGFRYLQVAAGSRRQAALGSDQQIYTWNNEQSTPTILDANQNTKFTSISLNDDLLLAVDRQGQVHTFQTDQADSRNSNPKLLEQATTGLPGQAQAVTAAASDSRTLALDSDGQAWTWDANSIGKAKPVHIRQDTEMRTVQVQALGKEFLLLDADGQAWYLADSTTDPTAVSLPEGMKASRISTDKNQAIITDKEGRVWSWQPGGTPVRADDGSRPYTQAVLAGGRITAISRQGGLHQWSLDGQGRPGKPARINTTQAPTLETASTDSQPLKLTRNNDSWQTDMPAHKPGPATITITGSQDNQPFTRNLDYTVDQPLTRDIREGSTHTVSFDTAGGSPAPGLQQVDYPYGRVQRPTPDPAREGYLFDGWFTGNTAYDFSKPVTQNLTLTAHWTFKDPDNTWKINPDRGSQFGNETTTITPPDTSRGIRFSQVSGGGYAPFDVTGGYSLAVGSDGNAYAWGYNKYGQLGNGTTTQQNTPVPVPKPEGTPTDFTYVQVVAGGYHSLAIGSDGYVYAWGNNNRGQLGNNTKSNSSTPVRVHGPNNTGEGLKAIQVSAGAWNSMALAADGTVYTWGSFQSAWAVSSNLPATVPQTVPTTVEDPSDASSVFHAVQISTRWSFDMAIGQDGYVYAWGYNTNGQLGNNTSDGTSTTVFHPTPSRVFASSKSTAAAGPWLKAIQVSAGVRHALAIDEDGNTWSWGRNNYGELGNGTSTGEHVANPVPVRVQYPASTGTVTAVQVSAGANHSIAVDTNGNTWAWGRNDYGQLGNNTTSNQSTPVKVFASAQSTSSDGPWLNAVQISAGYFSSAIGADGYAKVWGQNNNGQLGNGTTSGKKPNPVPVSVMFPLQPVITAARFDTSLATNLNHISNSNSVTVLTPAHQPGTVTVSVDYTMGGAGSTLTDTSLRYTYLPAGVLPQAGGEGILLTLATGMTGMGAMLASRRHRRETHQLLHASHE